MLSCMWCDHVMNSCIVGTARQWGPCDLSGIHSVVLPWQQSSATTSSVAMATE